MTSRHASLFAFLLCVAAIFYFDLKKCQDLPWPPRLILTGLVFGLLDLFALVSESMSNVMTVGFVIAMFVNKAFVGDCSHKEAGTTQASDTSFITGSDQPPSYSSFQTSPTELD